VADERVDEGIAAGPREASPLVGSDKNRWKNR
jgi:hypothetical protein